MADVLSVLDPALGAVAQQAITLGHSGARVLRMLNAAGRPVAVVKLADNAAVHLAEELKAEAIRLEWLAGLGVPVPEVLGAGVHGSESWLAVRALAGRPASDPWPVGERENIVDLLAQAARELHATAAAGAIVDRSLSAAVADARLRVESGLVRRSWDIAGRPGAPPDAVLAGLEQMADNLGEGEPAVTHGDFCLPNVLVAGARVTGFVDVGRAGVADPHSDIADMARSLRSHLNPQFGPAAADRFLTAYGRERIDPRRLQLHDLLETFFWPVPEALRSNG